MGCCEGTTIGLGREGVFCGGSVGNAALCPVVGVTGEDSGLSGEVDFEGVGRWERGAVSSNGDRWAGLP
jgi:hypothetical protein